MYVKTVCVERNVHNWDVSGSKPGEYYGYVVLANEDQETRVKIPKYLMDTFISHAANIAFKELSSVVQNNNPNSIIIDSLNTLVLSHEANDA